MSGILDHLASGATTVCRAWSLTRQDGFCLGFTDHDLPLAFEGVTFRADSGMTSRALESTSGLSVDNSEALGVLSDPEMTEADINAGLFDGAAVICWLVNWANVEERVIQFRGSIGDITLTGQQFTAEIRGMSEALNLPMGRLFHSECAAILGDRDCRAVVDVPAFRTECTIEDIHSGGALSLIGLEAYEAGWFAHGQIEVQSGAVAGARRTIKADAGLGWDRLVSPWDVTGLAKGDELVLTAGCDRRAQTCKAKFGNFLNFRGFPDIPGDDWLMQSPVTEVYPDGGSRR